MNEKLEQRKRDDWLDKKHNISMDIPKLVKIAVQGHVHCPENEPCLSRSSSGNDACQCVRSIFATPEHYELYLCLRQVILEAELIHQVTGDYYANRKAE